MNECISWLAKHRSLLPIDSAMVDVGAYQGMFAEEVFTKGLCRQAWLFEPHPINLDKLRTTTFSRPVTIVASAVGDSNGSAVLQCDQDLATGSLLAYNHAGRGLHGPHEVVSFPVCQTTLDRFFENLSSTEKIGLLKIDTQGADLKVLRGAEATITSQQPWVVVEMICVPLYIHQAAPQEIWAWFSDHQYTLAGFFNDHYSADGWLSFTDALFMPDSVRPALQLPFSPTDPSRDRPETAEIQMLRKVCEERLELIQYLHAEAEKRLDIIRQLEKQIRLLTD